LIEAAVWDGNVYIAGGSIVAGGEMALDALEVIKYG